jgi:hypothetical protein
MVLRGFGYLDVTKNQIKRPKTMHGEQWDFQNNKKTMEYGEQLDFQNDE